MASKFSTSEVCFKDTRGSGIISIRGVQLEADKDGFIEAPAEFASDLEPHGFIQQDRPAKGRGAKAAEKE